MHSRKFQYDWKNDVLFTFLRFERGISLLASNADAKKRVVKFFFDARLQCKNDVFFTFRRFERGISLLASKADARKGG